MSDTPTPRKNRTLLWIVLAVIAALLFACLAAAFGGALGYTLGRTSASREATASTPRMERVLPPDAAPIPEMIVGRALVVAVTEDSPAAHAGLREGDLILAVDGEALDAEVTLADRIREYEPGDEVALTVLRNGRERTITVTLGRHPDDADAPWMGLTYQMHGVPGMRFRGPAARDRLLPFSG